MKKYSFSKKRRLTSKKEIDELFRFGKFKAVNYLKFRYLSQDKGYSRVVISISKRVGSAPIRNRLKRLIKEAIRLSVYLKTSSYNLSVYITYPIKNKPTLAEIQNKIDVFINTCLNETEN